MNTTYADAIEAAVNPQDRVSVVREARRERAEAVLQSLIAAKAECEKQLSRFKRPDMIKAVRGQSAIDTAIDATRRMIAAIDTATARASSASTPVTTIRTSRRHVVMSDRSE